MAKTHNFSRHAFDRLEQRSRLSVFEASDLLDFGLTVNVGSEVGFSRRHLLFYSPTDEKHYVAIEDEVDGTIVTILPLAYHERLAWPITEIQLNEARQLAGNVPTDFGHPRLGGGEASRILLSAHYLDSEGGQKTKVVKKYDAQVYQRDLWRILRDRDFAADVESSCRERGIDVGRVFGVSIRLGKEGHPVVIDWNALANRGDLG